MKLSVQFVENDKMLSVSFNEFEQGFNVSFDNYQAVTEFIGALYEGEYEVTPKVTEQTMETKEKVMAENVTILAIPYYDVGNTAGGSTVFIGG
jgi:hypothetical protein